MFQEIKASLSNSIVEDQRPWLVGFSGGRAEHDRPGVADFGPHDVVLAIPAEHLCRPVSISVGFAIPLRTTVYCLPDFRFPPLPR